MASFNESDFSVHVDEEPGSPHRLSSQSNSEPGTGPLDLRGGPVAEALTSPLRPSPQKGKVKRNACIVIGSMLLLGAVCAAISYLVFVRPGAEGGSERNADAQDSAGTSDTNGSDRGGILNGDTATDIGTVEAPGGGSESEPVPAAPDTASSDPGNGNAAGAGAASGAQAPPSAPVLTPAPTKAPAPLLPSVPVNPKLGFFGPVQDMPVIPVAAAVLPSGKVLMWSAETPDDYANDVKRYVVGGAGRGKTYHAVWDPATNDVTAMLVGETDHDMFCPGITMLPDGDIIVTGGQNADKTSIYHLADGTWNVAPNMHISRGYGSSCLLSNGKVFVLGGSWSGPKDLHKDAEIYDPTLGEWSLLPGIQAKYMLTDDPEDKVKGTYRADNYGWFFSWSNGTDGPGSAMIAGTRPGGNSANGNAVMYDAGKILTCGGSEAFALEEYPATTEASIISIIQTNKQVKVKSVAPMHKARVYANACVLPDGKVFITGGAHTPKEFSDKHAHYEPEIWDPATETFTLLETEHKIGRTYHSTGVLLLDGRVFTGGGGLCGNRCSVNHLDAEIFNPPYLFNDDGSLAPRPTISLSVSKVLNGGKVWVTSSEQLMMVSMIRMGSATHSTNTDQRRIELCGPFTTPCDISPVSLTIHADPGVALGGNWMVFGVNAQGVPSVASNLLVGM